METCNLCGGTDWHALEEVGTVRVVRCRCGLEERLAAVFTLWKNGPTLMPLRG